MKNLQHSSWVFEFLFSISHFSDLFLFSLKFITLNLCNAFGLWTICSLQYPRLHLCDRFGIVQSACQLNYLHSFHIRCIQLNLLSGMSDAETREEGKWKRNGLVDMIFFLAQLKWIETAVAHAFCQFKFRRKKIVFFLSFPKTKHGIDILPYTFKWMHCSLALFTICDSVVNKITLMANSKPTRKKSEEKCAKITDTLTESVKWCIDMKWQIPVFFVVRGAS